MTLKYTERHHLLIILQYGRGPLAIEQPDQCGSKIRCGRYWIRNDELWLISPGRSDWGRGVICHLFAMPELVKYPSMLESVFLFTAKSLLCL